MIILLLSVIIFNYLAFKTNERLTKNHIVHIWVFTIAFQLFFDIFVDLKYHGYWYITKGIDWLAFPAYTALIPPVNIMFLNWFPFKKGFFKIARYIFVWELFLLFYEWLANSPSPWGYFRYGWWNLGISAIINPILLFILVGYYKWILKIEKE
ncbi:hypothetical protein [Metabacillus niabensis]|uniref:hypothetical protein n=1 Tax=Metabacillus niabensis TaxID=324854 RepID=UPI001CFBFA94|nr:hypothetical protein [Metabacillus niabensis]